MEIMTRVYFLSILITAWWLIIFFFSLGYLKKKITIALLKAEFFFFKFY